MYGRPQEGSAAYWHDRTGKPLGRFDEAGKRSAHREISPDGSRVAYDDSGRSGGGEVWVVELERGIRSRITTHPGRDWVPAWSPDGRRIAFTTERDTPGKFQIWVAAADGSGVEQPLLVDDHDKHHLSWSPDGKFLAYDSAGDIWVLPLEKNSKPSRLLATEFAEGLPEFSPDGRWLAYVSDRSGRLETYVREFPGGPSTAAVQISLNGGVSPRWRKDGKEIYYLDPVGNIMVVPLQLSGGVLKPGLATSVFRSNYPGTAVAHFTMTGDAQRFLFPSSGGEIQRAPLVVVMNWLAGVKR